MTKICSRCNVSITLLSQPWGEIESFLKTRAHLGCFGGRIGFSCPLNSQRGHIPSQRGHIPKIQPCSPWG